MGETDLYLLNAKKMGLDIDSIKNALISHGHYDHGGGATYLRGKDIFVHKQTFQKRFKPATKEFNKLDETLKIGDGKTQNNFIAIESNIIINDKIFLLANIPMVNKFELGYYAVLENDESDKIIDEISVAIKIDKGLVIISGCAHRGICNTIEYAKQITGEQRIHHVVGGFHLRKWDDVAEKTLEYFKANKVDCLLMAHCNGDDVIEKFKKELPEIVKIVSVGMAVEI